MSKKKREPNPIDMEKGLSVINELSSPQVLEFENKDKDPYEGLNDQQRTIARLRMRGMSQTVIGNILGISQPVVSRHLAKIAKHMAARGESVDQNLVVGEASSLYEEVEHKAWELYTEASQAKVPERGEQIKALQLIMQAREKHIKMLMDLGRLEKASNRSTVEVTISPGLEKWTQAKKEAAVQDVLQYSLSELPAPTPPEEEDIEDGELI